MIYKSFDPNILFIEFDKYIPSQLYAEIIKTASITIENFNSTQFNYSFIDSFTPNKYNKI